MTTSVDVQGMQLAQQDFQQALDQINSVYGAMTEEQDTLTANWSGMAASAFGQALTAWLDDLYQIRQELVVMTESLSVHTGIYSDANEASQQVVTAFQQGLDGLEALPVDGMVALRRERGVVRSRQPLAAREMTVRGAVLRGETPRMALEGKLLPTLPEETPQMPLEGRLLPELPTDPGLPLLPEETWQKPLEGRLLPELPTDPGLPLLPTRRLANLEEEPLLPEETPQMPLEGRLLPELPSEPGLPLLPALPTLPALPEETWQKPLQGRLLPELPTD